MLRRMLRSPRFPCPYVSQSAGSAQGAPASIVAVTEDIFLLRRMLRSPAVSLPLCFPKRRERTGGSGQHCCGDGGYFLAAQDVALPGGFPALCFPKRRERTGGGPSPPPPVPPGSGQPKSPLRGPFDRCRQAVGSGRGNVLVNHGPQPASMRAAPACRQRLSDFEADNTGSFSWLPNFR